MDIRKVLRDLSYQPLTHQLLSDVLKGYKRPNDKIHALRAAGLIEPLKRGFYIAGKKLDAARPEHPLLANHLLGPSYVSVDSALSYHGLIPERVYTVASMTTKASRKFQTSIALFTYTYLPLPYYAYGLMHVKLSENQFAVMASPEKALTDKIVTTAGLTLRSQSAAMAYVFENLRMEEEAVSNFNIEAITSWLEHAPKRQSLEMLVKMIDKL